MKRLILSVLLAFLTPYPALADTFQQGQISPAVATGTSTQAVNGVVGDCLSIKPVGSNTPIFNLSCSGNVGIGGAYSPTSGGGGGGGAAFSLVLNTYENGALATTGSATQSVIVPAFTTVTAKGLNLSCNQIGGNGTVVLRDLTSDTTLYTSGAIAGQGNTGPGQPGNSYIQNALNISLTPGHILALTDPVGNNYFGCAASLTVTAAP